MCCAAAIPPQPATAIGAEIQVPLFLLGLIGAAVPWTPAKGDDAVSVLAWLQMGCYTLSPEGMPQTEGTVQTHRECLDKCYAKGYPFASIDAQVNCRCGHQPWTGGLQSASGCDQKCQNHFPCGGAGKMTVYAHRSQPTPDGHASYVGCFKDNDTDRELARWSSTTIKDPCICIAECRRRHYIYAGTSHRNESDSRCFCSDTYGRHGKEPDASKCAEGPHALMRGTAGSVAVCYLKGCFEDNTAATELAWDLGSPSKLSVHSCIDCCNARGYPYAGLRNGDR
eukprot:GHVU01121934.1.p1 GENE.GHVU01121934.1~~GHVU01121934.1.p1  ORF type:complete len:282 (+),score=17.70 GHVU01121934.1:148-993(+)